jgi:long-subunit fatty acid transport protein
MFLPAPVLLTAQSSDTSISDTNFSGVVGAGARAFGMGGAFIAIADDATAASWNPGGLGQLEKPEFTLVLRFQNYRNMVPANGDGVSLSGAEDVVGSSYGFDFISFTYPIRIGNFKLVPQVSYQRAISYDLQFSMNNVYFVSEQYIPELEATIDYRGMFREKQIFTGGVDVVSLSLGTKLFKRINVGMSVNYWMNGYEGDMSRYSEGKVTSEEIPSLDINETQNLTESLSVDINGVNFNFGVLVDVLDNLKIGAVFKSSFTADDNYSFVIRQESFFSDTGDEPPVLFSGSGSSPLRWPETWGVGISYRPSDPLTLSADFTSTRWSAAIMKDFPYQDVETEQSELTEVYFPTMEPVTGEEGDFEQLDTFQFRVGMEYVLIGQKTLIPLRAGFFVDSQYYPDASGKRVIYYGFTGGVGYKRGGFGVDFAVLFETGNYLRDRFDYTVTRFTELRAYLSTNYSFN